MVILYPCKEVSFSSFIFVKFETYNALIRWDLRINALLIPLKYNNNNNNNNKNRSTNMYVCVLYVFLVERQGWPRSSLRTPPHPQVEWQATPRTICGTQTLTVLLCHLLDNRKANVLNLVLVKSCRPTYRWVYNSIGRK